MKISIKNLNILICDDSISNVLLLEKLLQDSGYKSITTITNPLKVLPTMLETPYDLLLLDIEMPGLSGIEVIEQIHQSVLHHQFIPVLVLTGNQLPAIRNKALEVGASDFLTKPFDNTEVLLRVRNLLRVRAAYLAQSRMNTELEERVEKRTQELEKATSILIQRLAQVGEMRDTETGRHVLRVGKYARVLSDAIGLPDEIGYMIEKAAPLHDLGKIGIPDKILLKKGKLTEQEREVMNGHAQMGADLLSDHESMLVQMAGSIALSHHECWDGAGYPKGLAGESIPIEGRITALSDVFDALTTIRPYKEAWTIDETVEYIKKKAGLQFDPKLVEVFVSKLETILAIKAQYDDAL
ncbi:MAG: response regulator [Gammaproteobacteria bacterium]|nr:response regulator [Gammaproteobacteria bacterium]